MSRLQRTICVLGTEIFSPFVLAGLLLVGVPLYSAQDWLWQALVGLTTVVAIPWGLSLYMAHSGRASDRWLYHRKQRYGFYGLSLVSILGGALVLLLTPSAYAVKVMICTLFGAVLAIALINFVLKASAHACVSAVFGTIATGLVDPWFVPAAVVIHAVVCWSRWAMKKHTVLELIVGSLLGVLAGLIFLALR